MSVASSTRLSYARASAAACARECESEPPAIARIVFLLFQFLPTSCVMIVVTPCRVHVDTWPLVSLTTLRRASDRCALSLI